MNLAQIAASLVLPFCGLLIACVWRLTRPRMDNDNPAREITERIHMAGDATTDMGGLAGRHWREAPAVTIRGVAQPYPPMRKAIGP